MSADDSAEAPDITDVAMDLLGMYVHRELVEMAGNPLGFVLVVTDGREFAVTANMPMDLMAVLLDRAAKRTQAKVEESAGGTLKEAQDEP